MLCMRVNPSLKMRISWDDAQVLNLTRLPRHAYGAETIRPRTLEPWHRAGICTKVPCLMPSNKYLNSHNETGHGGQATEATGRVSNASLCQRHKTAFEALQTLSRRSRTHYAIKQGTTGAIGRLFGLHGGGHCVRIPQGFFHPAAR